MSRWVQDRTQPMSPPTDHLVSHDSRALRIVGVVWNPTPTVVQHKGPHYTYIMYAAPVLFHVSVLSTICLHLISTCSMGHDPRDIWMMDPSISLVTCLVPLQRCPANISWCVVHPLRCKGYGPYRQALPARESLVERVTPSFFSRSYTSLMPSRALRLWRQIMTMGSDLMTRASRVPTHGPSARWLTSVRSVY